MIRWILIAFVAILLYSYSILRYYDAWKRGKIPVLFYKLMHAVSLAVCVAVWLQLPGCISDVFVLIGSAFSSVYCAVMLLTPVLCFLRGMIRFLGKRFHWRGKVYRFINHPLKLILCFLILTAVAGVFGFINERTVRRTEYPISLDDKREVKKMSVVFLLDLRVGSRMTQAELSRLIEQINDTRPDLILLGGNTIGKGASSQTVNDTIGKLQKLSAVEGIYLTEGPEDAGILEQRAEELEKRGLHFLRDECIFLNNGFQLVGCRESGNEKRKPLSYTLSLLDPQRPSLLLSYDRVEEEILQTKRMDVVLSRGLEQQYGCEKNGSAYFLGTSGLRAAVFPGRYRIPSEFVICTLTP